MFDQVVVTECKISIFKIRFLVSHVLYQRKKNSFFDKQLNEEILFDQCFCIPFYL